MGASSCFGCRSDGSAVDYGNWFPDEPNNSGGTEDEIEMRMTCDGYA